MSDNLSNTSNRREQVPDSEERLRRGEAASGIATFEVDLETKEWSWTRQATLLFGAQPSSRLEDWGISIFGDDVSKIIGAVETAETDGTFQVEFRVRHPDRSLHWIAGRGQVGSGGTDVHRLLRGAFYEITDRKTLEARLLALNEILEARVLEARHEAHTLEVLNQTALAVSAEQDLQRLVQVVTDAGVELSHAQFGAFFFNATKEDGDGYALYTLSGASREAFSKFLTPRNTALFEPTFRGRAPVRSDDILKDPRYGKNIPYDGMPEGHLPVRSYLAVSVVSRSGEVVGGLFFGHPQPRVFTERAERIVSALAAHAAVAIDNVRLHSANQREIEARRQAEAELQDANKSLAQRAEKRAKKLTASVMKLEDTERRFRLLVEGVTDYAIYMLDSTGNVVNWNPGAARIKGYSRDEVIGRHFSVFFTPEDQDADVPHQALAIASQSGKYESEGWRVRKDGSRFWAGAVLNAIKDSSGKTIGFAKITRDLTERRAAEERSRQAQKMEAIGQLTGGVAHDFNNLLTIIIGNLEALQRNSKSTDPDIGRIQRSAENAMQGARRAEILTQRLLAFSRQQPLDPKPVDIGRLVTGISDLLRRTLGEKTTIETVLGGGIWLAHADPNQLELAILNLVVNSRDAMPNGGKVTIETANVYLDDTYAAAQAEVIPGQYVMVAITDNGTGMTAEVKAKAFDPFFTTKDVGQGTGLGLSQVYGFAKQSRGHVKIYSELGEGTTIKLYLPRVHSVASAVENETVDPPVRGSKNETILVVEDDPGVRSYSSEALAELGYKVVEADNARAGLNLLDSNPDVHVLFTDIGLPGGMNGRQLAEEAMRRQPGLKVLFTTGYARNAIVHDGRLDPGVELITKPFTQAKLAAKLRDIVDAKRANGRVLVVEDEALIRLLATGYLEEAGFTVDGAGSATEAVNKMALTHGGIDAVIVDMGLPDRGGDTLVKEIRSLHPNLPIVLASGRAMMELRDEFKGGQRIEFVAKPYSATDLLEALARLGLRAQS
jgi:PAS domain S-box-containing protein